MKQIIYSLGLLVLVSLSVSAQDSLTQKPFVYMTKVISSRTGVNTGYLMYVTDSTLNISKGMRREYQSGLGEIQIQRFNYTDLQMVQCHRTGAIGKGIAIGGIVGAAAGVLFGYIAAQPVILFQTYDPATGGKYMRTGALAGVIGGGIIGYVIGAFVHKTFLIGGNRAKFSEMRGSLLEKIYSKNLNNQ
jgi:hypothetical protein